jgi:hypothetical protein
MNLSKISLNLLTEEVYLQGMINKMYENIIKENNQPQKVDNSLIRKVIQDLNLNADFMLTYGLGISGFVGPVTELLINKNINVTEYDVTLLIMVVFYILLKGSSENIKNIMDVLKTKKLDGEVKSVLNFISKSLTLFKIVGKKFGVTITTLVDVLAFTFLSVPVLGVLKNVAAEKGFDINHVDELIYGVGLSASTYMLKNVLNKKNIKESTNEYEWTKELGDIDLSGWYVTKPTKWGNQLRGSLYYVVFNEKVDTKVRVWVLPFTTNSLNIQYYIESAKHEVKHLEDNTDMLDKMDGPYYWNPIEVLEFVEEGYFIKLS